MLVNLCGVAALALMVCVCALTSKTPHRPVVASSDENPVAVAADIATSVVGLIGLAFWLAVFVAPFAIVWWCLK